MATTLVITGMAMTNTSYASTSKDDTSFAKLAEQIVLQYDKMQNSEQCFGGNATKVIEETLDGNTAKPLGNKAREITENSVNKVTNEDELPFNKAVTEIEKIVDNLNQHRRFSEKFQKELDNM